MPANANQVYRVYNERRARDQNRLWQGHRVRDVLTNNIDVVFKDVVRPGDEPVVGNLVWAAARTIAQRVGRPPRLDVQPSDQGPVDKDQAKAEAHAARLNDYSVRMGLAGTRLQAAFWLVAHDLAPLVIRPSPEHGIPVIEIRDPLTCLPGSVSPHKPDVVNCLFAHKVSAWHARNTWPQVGDIIDAQDEQVENVTVGEFFDGEGLTVVLLEPALQFLDFHANPCPNTPMVVLSRGFSPDLSFHGQFDHCISALIAQAKLFSMVMAYASQQVAAETVVVGEITSNAGKWATGPGAVNQITPMPGAQASKLVNNMSTQVFDELDRLERAIRLGGQFPAQLSGEPVATIATGKGMEQLTLTVDDNVNYWQSVLDDTFRRAYLLVPPIARAMQAPGCEDFADEKVQVYVRSLSGADPAETVRLLQMQGAKNLSRLTIMERLPEVDSPLRELERMDVDDMRQALIHSLDQQVLTGQLTPDLVARMIQERKSGKDIEEIYTQITKLQQEAAQAQQEQMGAAGQPQQPQQAPSLADMLNPTRLAGQAAGQGIRAARTSPETRQISGAQGGGLAAPPGPVPATPPGTVG